MVLFRLASKLSTGRETSISGTSDFAEGKRSLKQKTSVKTEILFLERCWQFLKSEGRIGIVLPDGILTTSTLQPVRDWLLEHFQLLAIISLPQYSFAHYGAGVKASLVFLKKRKNGEIPSDNEPVFMAVAENIGYDASGHKTFKVIKTQETEKIKTEISRCDLFDMRFIFEQDSMKPGEWIETHREVLPNTGILEKYEEFKRNPEPFFA